MFVIITYDVGEKRVNKIRKKLKKCLAELNKILNKEEDSLYIYRVKNSNNINKDIVGFEKNYDDLFI